MPINCFKMWFVFLMNTRLQKRNYTITLVFSWKTTPIYFKRVTIYHRMKMIAEMNKIAPCKKFQQKAIAVNSHWRGLKVGTPRLQP